MTPKEWRELIALVKKAEAEILTTRAVVRDSHLATALQKIESARRHVEVAAYNQYRNLFQPEGPANE